MSINVPQSVATVLDQADCSGAVSEEFISAVERQYGLAFHSEYRAFLSRYGAALLSGFELHGLLPSAIEGEPPYWTDIRALLGKQSLNGLPSSLVPISDDGGDFKFYLSCAAGPGLGTVLVYGPGADGKPVSHGFFEFVERAARGSISELIPAS